MSDFTVPLRAGNVPSLFGAMQQYGQAQQSLLEPLRTQQATALIGQQVQAARIQNLRTGLNFALFQHAANQVPGFGQGGYDPNAAASGSPGGTLCSFWRRWQPQEVSNGWVAPFAARPTWQRAWSRRRGGSGKRARCWAFPWQATRRRSVVRQLSDASAGPE